MFTISNSIEATVVPFTDKNGVASPLVDYNHITKKGDKGVLAHFFCQCQTPTSDGLGTQNKNYEYRRFYNEGTNLPIKEGDKINIKIIKVVCDVPLYDTHEPFDRTGLYYMTRIVVGNTDPKSVLTPEQWQLVEAFAAKQTAVAA